jgi:hypothetical protein
MKKILLLVGICFLIGMTYSCSLLKTQQSTAKMLFVNDAGIYVNPVVSDLVVGEKVKVTVTGKNEPTAALKNKAVTEALLKNNADVIVEPLFVVETNGLVRTVTLIGYIGTYKNFKSLEVNSIHDLNSIYEFRANPNVITKEQLTDDPKKTKRK